MDEFVIPSLCKETTEALPHVEALGETWAGCGYFVRKRVAQRQYMTLYIGKAELTGAQETGEVPKPLDAFFEQISSQKNRMYLIQATLEGRGLIDYGGETRLLEPGKFLLIDSGADHYLRTDPNSGSWHILWAYLSGPCVGRYYDAFIAKGAGQCVARMPDENRIEAGLRAIAELYRTRKVDQQNDLPAAALILDLLSSCVLAVHPGADAERIPAFVWQAREYITQHYAEKVTLEKLALLFSIDKFYLQKIYTQYFGLSPNEYLITTRMHRAKEALCATELSVGEIAERVGMNSASYFVRQFKKREGITPARYRQLMRPIANPGRD